MGALEQEHRDKLAQVNELLAINAELRRKHEALERAVAGNDEHITLIQALGSLSIKARSRQPGAGAPLDAAAAAQGQADATAEQQQQVQVQVQLEQQRRALPPASRTQSSPVQSSAAAAAGAHPGMPSSDSMGRSESAPPAPPPELMPEVEAAGPFGLVQLPQFGEDDDALLPADTEAAARGGDGSEQQQHEVPSWLAPLQLQDLSMREDGPQQQPSSLLAGMSTLGAAMGLTRSLSLPARTGGFDALLSPDGLAAEEFPGAGLTGHTPSRCFSATPPAWASRPASVLAGPAAAEAAGQAAWSGFAAVQQQQQAYGDAEGGGVPANTRPHSWSGATGSAAEAAAALQQQQEQQQQLLLRPMWGAVTTGGPPLSAATPQQQQLQQAAWQQQQQWQATNQLGSLAQPFAGLLPLGLPLEQQLLQPPCAFGATGTPLQPQQQQQQLVQQLQQMGDMAFGTGLDLQQQQQQQQQQFASQAGGLQADDTMLLDDDIMELLERASQQHSFDMLSPLPSIPSALLTGDSMRMVLAAEQQQGQAGGGGGLDPAAAGGAAHLQPHQQQHQQLFGGGAGHDAAAAAGSGGGGGFDFSSPPATLLEASRSLQARHRAAGFCPPASSPNEMLYLHEVVDWYR
jgi:hypothetical protein